MGFPGGSWEGNGNPLQSSCLENSMDRGVWWATVCGLTKSWMWLNTQHWWLGGKESVCQCRRLKFNPWVRKISCWRKWQAPPVILPGKSHGQQSLVGYSRGRNTVGHDLVTKQQNNWFINGVVRHFFRPFFYGKNYWDNKGTSVNWKSLGNHGLFYIPSLKSLSNFLIFANLTGEKWYFSVDLFGTSLI